MEGVILLGKKKNSFIWLRIIAITLIIMFASIGTACGDNSTKNTNVSLNKLVSEKFENGKLILDKNNSILTIQFTVPYTNEDNFVTQTLYNGENGVEEVYKNNEFKKYKIFRLESMSDFTDQYGKSTKEVGMRLTFPQTELQKVESFDNVTNEQFVQLQGSNRTYLHPSVGKNIKLETRQIILPTN